MKAFLIQFFQPIEDSEAATRKHLLWWILLRILLMCLLCVLAAIFRDKATTAIVPPLPQTSFFLLTLCIFSIVSALILQTTLLSGWLLRGFGLAQLWADAFFVAFFVYGTGCSYSDFTPLFILPIITAGLILYKPGSLILATISTFSYAAVLLIERYGRVPDYFWFPGTLYRSPESLTTLMSPFAFYGLLFFLAALLSGQMGTRLHRAHLALKATTQAYGQLAHLYRQIFNDISTGIITTDSSGHISSYNQAAESITGYQRDLVLGEDLHRYFPSMCEQVMENSGRHVCDFVKPDGESIRIGYSCSPLRLGMEDASGEDAPESLARVITLQDISQIERMERQMRESEKLVAIGEMSAMVAHDFRNPLAAISGSAQMLSMTLADAQDSSSQEALTLAAIILRETERMEKTIADFLLFARPQAPQPQWFQIRPVLEDQMLRFLAGKESCAGVSLQWEMPVELLFWADQQQIGELVRQLVENAGLATPDTEAVVLIRAQMQQDDTGASVLVLEVCDQGPGIPEELREEVFQPFFSRCAKGAGLGLAVVRQIVQQHRGTVRIAADETWSCIVRMEFPQPVAG